jgi:hypothetical protein
VNRRKVVDIVREGLSNLGYDSGKIARDYDFADFIDGTAKVRRIPLAAFSSYPPTYRNACAGLVFRDDSRPSAEFVFQHRSLGAPLLLEAIEDHLQPWAIGPKQATPIGSPVLIDEAPALFRRHRDDWNPATLGRIKSPGEVRANKQLDFFDLGLLPVLTEFFQAKLKDLLERAFVTTSTCYQKVNGAQASVEYLFPYLFRFVTAKIFMDRADAKGWDNLPSALAVLKKAESHSGSGLLAKLPETYLHEKVLAEAWSSISKSFHFQNLSVPDLAFIYESTFINEATRRQLGVHSTPPGLAEYIVQQLPWGSLPIEERRVFEPFSGHGIFLACAMERLREDLGKDLTPRQRHDYFRRMLIGVETDPLAIEVCRLVLTLSDYPNSNSWQLHQDDVFTWPSWDKTLASSSVILSNPPYESFSPDQRVAAGAVKTTPPGELIRRIMLNPPAMLGLVLPQSFLSSPVYQEANRDIAHRYGEVAIVELPEVFRYADNETVALLAFNRRKNGESVSIRYSEVAKEGIATFIKDFRTTRQRVKTVVVPKKDQSFSLFVSGEDSLWDRLSDLPKLDSFVSIRQGVHWLSRTNGDSRTSPRTDVASDIQWDGFHRGAEKMARNLSQFQLKHLRYLSLREEHQEPRTIAHKHPWTERKVVCNAARFERKSPWRIAGWADSEGLVFSQQFFAIWPCNGVSEFALAAILCSPIANAFSFRHDLERHNHISTLRSLPVPAIEHLRPLGILDKQCRLLQTMMQTDQPNSDRVVEQLLRLDAAVLDAYELPERVQRELLDRFQGWRRPLAVGFDRYFPDHFRDVISLRDLVTIQYDWEDTNDRRCDLIDKDLAGTATADDRAELEHLQLLADLLIRLKSPYPNDQLEDFISQLKAEGKWCE